MKKLILAAVALLGSVATFAQSEGKSNAIKVNILSPLVRTGSVFYERKVGAKSSVQLGVAYTGFNRDAIKINGLVITPEFRYYLSNSKEAIEGFYVAPYLRYQNLKIEDDVENKATLSSFGGGLLVGHQWVLSKVVTLDIFLGPNYNAGNVKVTQGADDFDIPGGFSGFGLRSGITLGVAF